MAKIIYDCRTHFIVESKSLKLYFNSLNNTMFQDSKIVETTIQKDLEKIVGGAVSVTVYALRDTPTLTLSTSLAGECIDDIDIECTAYTVNPYYLVVEPEKAKEILCSDLLKSNCLVTHQPDWGSVQIQYAGNKINREGLLRYLVSFRNHSEFH